MVITISIGTYGACLALLTWEFGGFTAIQVGVRDLNPKKPKSFCIIDLHNRPIYPFAKRWVIVFWGKVLNLRKP